MQGSIWAPPEKALSGVRGDERRERGPKVNEITSNCQGGDDGHQQGLERLRVVRALGRGSFSQHQRKIRTQ